MKSKIENEIKESNIKSTFEAAKKLMDYALKSKIKRQNVKNEESKTKEDIDNDPYILGVVAELGMKIATFQNDPKLQPTIDPEDVLINVVLIAYLENNRLTKQESKVIYQSIFK